MITILAYCADVAILGTYALMLRGHPVRWLNWANAIGAFPIAVTEVVGKTWPALVITVAFGFIGATGLVYHKE